MQAELAAEKRTSQEHKEDSRAKSKVIEGLILDKRMVESENIQLRHDVSMMYSRRDMIVITGGSAILTFLVTFIAVRSTQ